MDKNQIIKEIENRIKKKDEQRERLGRDFSERDSLGKVWTKKNSAYATVHSEVAELNDLLRCITQFD